ncbi:fatty acid elongase [Coccidioides immitis RS]|uniref:Elongation of fatty acids protein n=1 Tax=Coccidioides immitis (strain RS) TaxID=246410 RepID=J3KAF8_COCIM|nr:fatty acid elongase [Coccidioides immitis RS]EAS32005.3 fatty acid elongase [Coccidioides immitis RS]
MGLFRSTERPDLPSVHLGLPPRSLLRFPPGSQPGTIPAPPVERSWLQPFTIPPKLYNDALKVQVPITIALVYATTVILLNRINKKRGNRPWAISKTKPFHLFVVLHNVFLAVYSAWTFLGMLDAFRESWPARSEMHGSGLVNVVDAFCKINGPRGLGNAAVYDTDAGSWTIFNPEYKLGPGNVPDPTDVGRLWNKGLAFFGWIFYLSKFYEVLDTAIILAKGKKSSTLQTYHHAGAMMCMWAGIRFMAAPIWIFALVNSAIHALMYTYYTLTALSVRIPVRIKKSLTTMQILQFIFGTSLAASHLFIYYSIPFPVPHAVALRPLASVMPSVAGAANESQAGVGSWLKKLALRAAGHEGVAENIVNSNGTLFGPDGMQAAQAALGKQEIRYALQSRTFTCMDTSGQGFAIWLNVFYLLPLTWLFARFFIRSYLRRTETAAKRSLTDSLAAEKAGLDALKGVTREIQNAVIEMHGDGNGTTDNESGASTPQHPEAYEANVENIMSARQARAERRYSATTKHPVGISLAKGDSAGTRTPMDPAAYGANIEDIMTRKQQGVEEKAHRVAKHPEPPHLSRSSKEGIRTPLNERGYEANLEDVMSPAQRKLGGRQPSSEPKEKTMEAPWVPVRGSKAGNKKGTKAGGKTGASSSLSLSSSPTKGSGFKVLADEHVGTA